MTKIYLIDGPREAHVETIDECPTHHVRVGADWFFPRPVVRDNALNPALVDQYRIINGPDDGGLYGAKYVATEEY